MTKYANKERIKKSFLSGVGFQPTPTIVEENAYVRLKTGAFDPSAKLTSLDTNLLPSFKWLISKENVINVSHRLQSLKLGTNGFNIYFSHPIITNYHFAHQTRMTPTYHNAPSSKFSTFLTVHIQQICCITTCKLKRNYDPCYASTSFQNLLAAG